VGEVPAAATYSLDPRAPLFFVSYGRTQASVRQRDPDLFALEFFEELSINVTLLFGRAAGQDSGFFDRVYLKGGRRWSPEMFGAAATCQVFVPLISMPLLQSEWCAREWYAFAQRPVLNRTLGRPDNETAIVPVLWSPVEDAALPEVLRAVQIFEPEGLPDPSVAVNYQREGLYGLRMLGMDDAYRAVVWRLALRVAGILRSHWVQPMEPLDEGRLHNAFTEVRT
jgi:hypothetical protein